MSRDRYRIIYNHDGGTLMRPFAPFTDVPFSVDGFVDATIGHLVDTQVDAVTWCLGSDHGYVAAEQGPGRASNFYCHDTEVGERLYDLKAPFQSKVWRLQASRVREMVKEGNDPPKVIIEAGHRHCLDVLLGIRMNDSHDARLIERNLAQVSDSQVTSPFPPAMGSELPMRFPVFKDGRFIEDNIRGYICRLKREHPEWLIGSQASLGILGTINFDYSHQEVRDFRLSLIKEACDKYDLDGVELDFLRGPPYFMPGEEMAGMPLMTELIGHVRAHLDRLGEKRKKKLKLVIRTLAPLKDSHALGLDVQTWLQKGWIDGLISGICDMVQQPIEDDARVSHRLGCPFYATLKPEFIFRRMGYTPELFRAAAAYFYRSGADGIHMFNMNGLRDSPHNYRGAPGGQYGFEPLREIGSMEEIKHRNKRYFVDNLGATYRDVDSGAFHEWSEEIQNRFLTSEQLTTLARTELPARLGETDPVTLHFGIADNLPEAVAEGFETRVTLRLSMRDLTGGDHRIRINLNGSSLGEWSGPWEEYSVSPTLEMAVDPSLMIAGENTLDLSIRRGDPEVLCEVWIRDVDFSVEYLGKRNP